MVRRLGAAVVRRAVDRLLDPSSRRGAAIVLAAFHALDPDPYGAAVQAAGVVERYGATDEGDARAIRAEQGAWLHELFGTTIHEAPVPDSPVVRQWEATGAWVPEQAARMRHLVRRRDALLAVDAWMPVPQSGCAFAFGIEERPLPIGALCLLWDGWAAMLAECPVCGGPAVGYTMGGRSKVGGVVGCCLVCERELRRSVGGLATIAEAIRPVLEGTPYRVSRMSHPIAGGVPGEAEEFHEALRALVTRELLGEL